MSRSQADPLRVRRGNPVERSRKVSERLPNPAKTLADLPPGATITLHGWEERVEGLDRLVLGVLIKTRDGKTLADVRAIGIPGIDFEIANADAEHGWGPLAYDILMEKVTSLHSELGPGDASADALRVWDYYETSRPDVEMSEHGFTFTKKPKLLLKLAKMPNVVYDGDWKRPSRRAKSTRLPNPGNPVERTAHDHAEALARAISAQPGAPRVRAWSKPGVGARVYFANGDFVSVGRGGSLQATSRGRATFLESSLFPAQRAAYRAGVAAYLAELDAYFDEEASRHENPVKRRKPQGDPLFDAREMLGEVRRRRDDEEDGPPRILSVEAGQRLYHGEHVSWIGWPGRILKLGWDQVKPRQGNIFYPEKLAHFLGLIRSANAAGKRLRFPAPPAFILHRVDIDDVAERQAQAMYLPDDIAYDNLTRPYSSGDEGLDEYLANPDGYIEKHTFYGDEDGAEEIRADMAERKARAVHAQTGDLGNIVADLRDGNHRAFAAQLAGEPYVWVHVVEGEEGDLDRRLLK